MTISRTLVAAITLATLLGAAPGAGQVPEARQRRYAVVIGHNEGAVGEVPLRYAERDVERLRDALVAVGGFDVADVDLVRGQGADVVRQRLIAMNDRARGERSAGSSSVLFVFSSGHADSEALHLGDTRLPFSELEGLVRGSAADFRLLAVDACKSGELTASKGLTPAPRLSLGMATTAPAASGYVVLAAAAAGEDAHESDRLMGSFFTHHFISALRGAADADADGDVSLSEAYAYTFQETVKSSAQTLAGTQHPTYRYDMRGAGDLVLARARSGRLGGIVVPADHGMIVVDAVGGIVAELSRAGSRRLALGPGRYRLLVRGPRALYEGEVTVVRGVDFVLDVSTMTKSDYARLVRKGDADDGVQWSPRAFLTGHTPWQHDPLASTQGYCVGAGAGVAIDTRHVTILPRASLCAAAWENPFLRAVDTEVAVDVAALRVFDLAMASIAVGVTGGALVLHQRFETSGRAPPSTSLHPTLGLMSELLVPLPAGLSFVVDAEARSAVMAVRGTTKLETPLVLSVAAGLGVGF